MRLLARFVLMIVSAAPAYCDVYTFLSWADGWRGRDEAGRKVMQVQTSQYGLAIDVEKPAVLHLGPLRSSAAYGEAVSQPRSVVQALPEATLQLLATVDGVEYRCVRSAVNQKDMANFPVRIIESGRWLQRFDILQLQFEDANGNKLEAEGRLEVVAWPDALHLLLELSPAVDLPSTLLEIKLDQEQRGREVSRAVTALHAGEKASVALVVTPAHENEAAGIPFANETVGVFDLASKETPIPCIPDNDRGWWQVDLPERNWNMAEEPDHLDRFPVSLENTGDSNKLFHLVFAFDGPFTGVTGMSPMLRDEAGNPTGVPVQISKNWHKQAEHPFLYEGPWFHGASMITVKPHSTWKGELAIVYARWGGVPAVSHAQLCLVGWGTNQLWEQVAIGSWGESITYDPDVNLNRSMIDDVRPLMVTGMHKAQWSWTHNVGGGDFLVYFDEAGKKQYLTNVKTAHLAYGPNLTRAVYAGVSADGKIAARIEVSTPRVDDVNRSYHTVRYDVLAPTTFSRLAFYQLGSDNYNDHQFTHIARGNLDGMKEEWETERGGKRYLREPMAMEGEAPWFSIQGGFRPENAPEGAWANRGLVVRAWKARLGGQDIATPFAAVYGTENGPPSANVELVPPPGLTTLQPGDFVEAEVELLIVPQSAGDYYGPNEALREDLKANGGTWKVIHRLVSGNALSFDMHHGTLLRNLPVDIEVDDRQQAEFIIRGGIGYVPITFRGLSKGAGYELRLNETVVNQAVHGNDFWQTVRQADKSYSQTYNLNLEDSGGTAVVHFGPSEN